MLLKLIILNLSVIILAPLNLKSQVNTEWVRRYNGIGNYEDYPSSIGLDKEGNVYVAGTSMGLGTGTDYVTIKYNSSGTLQWEVRYNGPANSNDEASAMKVDKFGNTYVTGFTFGIGTNKDYTTIKYNSNGEEQWIARYNGPANIDDGAVSIIIDESANIFVTGNSQGIGTSYDYATVKYDSAGEQLWVARYDGPAHYYDFGRSIALDESGNIYVTGSSFGQGTREDFATIKYNPEGELEWSMRFNGAVNNFDEAISIAIGKKGDVYVTGNASHDTISRTNFTTIKYSTDGQQQWISRYNRPGGYYEYVEALVLDSFDNVYITGGSHGEGGGGYWDCATIKYNSDGIMQWAQRYNGAVGISIALDASDGVYVGGGCVGANWDFAIIKYNSTGTQQWVTKYSGPGEYTDGVTSIALDSNKNVYVTGHISDSSSDFCTIKYSQTVSINQLSSIVPIKCNLYQNYPNPFNPLTNIHFEISKNGFVKLIIVDIRGKEVNRLVNESLSSGSYSVVFDAGKLPSGIYFYKLESPNFSKVKKMILIK